MKCLDEKVVVKSLRCTVVCCWVLSIPLCCNLRASKSIDWTLELVVDAFAPPVSISKQFLVLCQWIMQGNVLVERQMNYQAALHFDQNLEAFKNLLKSIAGGRNIVLTKIHDKPVMVLTGIGPACDNQQKYKFETTSGIKIVDIVESLPCGEEKKCRIRDVMFKMVLLRRLANKLFKYLKENKEEAFRVRPLLKLEKDIQLIGELPDPITSELFKSMISAISGMKSSITNKTDYNNSLNIKCLEENIKGKGEAIWRVLETFPARYQEIREYYDEYLKEYFTTLRSILDVYHPDDEKQGRAREGLASMYQKNTRFDLVATMLWCAQAEIPPKKSLLGIGEQEILGHTDSQGHEQSRVVKNLGNVFHSEVIYYYYLQCNGLQPETYFFTQRDLCETCRPIVNEQSAMRKMNVVVLSAIPAQGRSQGEGPTVDGELLWSDSTDIWSSEDLNVATEGKRVHVNPRSKPTFENLFRIRIPSLQQHILAL